MRHLILGDGLLGKELKRQSGYDFISRSNDGFDFDLDFDEYCRRIREYDTIINCIAFTKTYSDDRERNWNINYKRVCDLVDFCNKEDIKLIHISTDYVYSGSIEDASVNDIPVHCQTWYGYTKLISDAYVQLRSNKYLLIRTSFKPNPFPYNKAYTNQIGNFDYVDIIADKILQLIKNKDTGVYNVGTEKKSMYQLALRSRDYVLGTEDMFDERMPKNITMKIGN